MIHRIQPAKFEGEQLPDEAIHTKWQSANGERHVDRTELELYCHPGTGGGKVEAWFGQSRIVEDITRIEGLNIPPFSTGELEGTVAPTFLLPDVSRHDFIRDPEGRFAAWIKDMQDLAKRLNERLETRSREARDTVSRVFERDLRAAVRDVATMLSVDTELVPRQSLVGTDEIPFTPKKSPRSRHESETEQDILDKWKDWVWQLLEQGVTSLEEIQKRIKKEHKVTLDKSRISLFKNSWEQKGKTHPGRKVATGEERRRRAEVLARFSISFQPIWNTDSEHPLRSRYNREQSVIEINVNHPDYLAVKKEEGLGRKSAALEPFFRYVAELTVKELTPIYFSFVTDTVELMERFMDMRNQVWERLGLK